MNVLEVLEHSPEMITCKVCGKVWFGLGTSDFSCGQLVVSLVLLVVVAISVVVSPWQAWFCSW